MQPDERKNGWKNYERQQKVINVRNLYENNGNEVLKEDSRRQDRNSMTNTCCASDN